MNNENVTNQLENNVESMEEHLEGLREFAELHPEMKSHYETVELLNRGDVEDLFLKDGEISKNDSLEMAMIDFTRKGSKSNYRKLIKEIEKAMMFDHIIAVPVYVIDGQLFLEQFTADGINNWVPVYTNLKAAQTWPRESELRLISLARVIHLELSDAGSSGIALNPSGRFAAVLDDEHLEELQHSVLQQRLVDALLPKGPIKKDELPLYEDVFQTGSLFDDEDNCGLYNNKLN